jgi:hypothetical protein
MKQQLNKVPTEVLDTISEDEWYQIMETATANANRHKAPVDLSGGFVVPVEKRAEELKRTLEQNRFNLKYGILPGSGFDD